jgi:hypothetical protein
MMMEGYLTKQGSVVKNWRKRYFVFDPETRKLDYYKTHQKKKKKGSMVVDKLFILPEDRAEKKPHRLDFIGTIAYQDNQVTISASAESEELKNQWLKAVTSAKGVVTSERSESSASALRADSMASTIGRSTINDDLAEFGEPDRPSSLPEDDEGEPELSTEDQADSEGEDNIYSSTVSSLSSVGRALSTDSLPRVTEERVTDGGTLAAVNPFSAEAVAAAAEAAEAEEGGVGAEGVSPEMAGAGAGELESEAVEEEIGPLMLVGWLEKLKPGTSKTWQKRHFALYAAASAKGSVTLTYGKNDNEALKRVMKVDACYNLLDEGGGVAAHHHRQYSLEFHGSMGEDTDRYIHTLCSYTILIHTQVHSRELPGSAAEGGLVGSSAAGRSGGALGG